MGGASWDLDFHYDHGAGSPHIHTFSWDGYKLIKRNEGMPFLKVLSPSNVVLGWPQHGSPFNDDLHDALVVSVHVTNNTCWMELRQQENKTTAWIHLHGVQRVFLEHMETINVLWSLEITQIGETLELNLNSSVGLSGTIAALSATYSTTPPNC